MATTGQFAARILTFGTIAVLTAGVAAMAAYSIAHKLVPTSDPLWEDLRCYLNVPLRQDERCFQKRVVALEEQWKGLVRKGQLELASLQQREQEAARNRDALAKRLAALQEIEDKVTDFSLFTKKSFRGVFDVHTGVSYKSFVRAQEWDRAWCYWNPPARRQATIHIDLGDATPRLGVKWRAISDAELSEAGVSRADIDQAKTLCVWPTSVS